MTIRLLSTYDGFPPNSIITLDSALETALIAGGNATATLTGGVVAYQDRTPLMVQNGPKRSGTARINANRRMVIPLDEGMALTITGDAGVVGTAQRYDAAGAAGSAITLTSGAMAPIGPYAGNQTVEIKVNAVGASALVQDGVLGIAAASASDIAFSQTIPLTSGASAYMPQQAVSGALTFTPMAGAVRNSLVYLRLVADGANTPNFSAFKEWGGSMGYLNTAGIANQVQFFNDGVDNFYSVAQAVNAQPIDTAPPVVQTVTMNGATAVMTYNEALNTTAPTLSSLSLSVNGGAGVNPTAAVVSGSAITLTFTAPATNGQTLTLNYTPGASPIRDLAGNNAVALTARAVTNTTPVAYGNVIQLGNKGSGIVESGNGTSGYSYTGTGAGFANNSAVAYSATSIPASADGSVLASLSSTAAGITMVGLQNTSTLTLNQYTSYLAGIYSDIGGTNLYRVVVGGTVTAATVSRTPLVGDIIKCSRVGLTFTLSVSSNGGASFDVIHTIAGASQAQLFLSAACTNNANSGAFNVRSLGVA